MSTVKKSKRKNRFKIKCLEFNTIMDSDQQNKRNKRFHLNFLKNRKSIRWEVLNTPKDTFIILSDRNQFRRLVLVRTLESKNFKQIRM